MLWYYYGQPCVYPAVLLAVHAATSVYTLRNLTIKTLNLTLTLPY